jgi:hypothetical protein
MAVFIVPVIVAAVIAAGGVGTYEVIKHPAVSAIVGKTLVQVGDSVVQAECSSNLSTETNIATKTLSIVAPTSSTAKTVSNALNTNLQVANAICPALDTIVAKKGAVPSGAPTQVVTIPAVTPAQ